MFNFYTLLCVFLVDTEVVVSYMPHVNFEGPCSKNMKLIDPQAREEKTRSAIECSLLCARTQTEEDSSQTRYCYGFNFCKTTHSCELIIRNKNDLSNTECSHTAEHLKCRHFRVSNGFLKNNRSLKIDAKCTKGKFRKAFDTSDTANIAMGSLRDEYQDGNDITIKLKDWNSEDQLILHADFTVMYYGRERMCAQSLWNLEWDENSGHVNQTLFIICTDTGVSLQKWKLGRINEHVESLQVPNQGMVWFTNGRQKDTVMDLASTSLDVMFQNGFNFYVDNTHTQSQMQYSVAFSFSAMFLSKQQNTNILLYGQFPWTVSVNESSSDYVFETRDLHWHSMLFSSGQNCHATKWDFSVREKQHVTNNQLESTQSTWKVDRCWTLVYETDSQSKVVQGQVGDLIYHIQSGRRVRIVDGLGWSSEPASLLIHGKRVFALSSMMQIYTSSSSFGMKRFLLLYSSNNNLRFYMVVINDAMNRPFLVEHGLQIKWFVDGTDWKQAYSTDNFQLGTPSLEEAFKNAIDYGATVRVQIPYNCSQLFMTLDNLVYNSMERSIIATAVRHVQINVEDNVASLTSIATSEFFRLYSNGTVVISRFTYETREFVDSETMHDVPIKWFVNTP